jgi:hypothetical protein
MKNHVRSFRHRLFLLAAAVALACAATGCVGSVSIGMSVPGPYAGPYGGHVYVGTSVPVGW